MTMCTENLGGGGGCSPTLSCSREIKEPRAMDPTGLKSWSYSERLIILISRVPDEKAEFWSRLRNVHFLFVVNVYTFLKNQERDCAEEGTQPVFGSGLFFFNLCFLYCDIFRTQNNMLTFRRGEQKTRKSKPGTFLIHSWTMRKFPFDFIETYANFPFLHQEGGFTFKK